MFDIRERKKDRDKSCRAGAQRTIFYEKVYKPSLGVNVSNFELNVFNASVPWSPSDPKINRDALIEVL